MFIILLAVSNCEGVKTGIARSALYAASDIFGIRVGSSCLR